jgi:N-acetylmuramoyl-L-alanine amidase
MRPPRGRTTAPPPAVQQAIPVSTTPPAAINQVTFSVQLAASPNPLDTSAGHWRDLAYPIEVLQEDQLYKYQARNFSDLHSAMDARFYLRAQGFTEAFIVPYKGGKRITLEQARNELNKN